MRRPNFRTVFGPTCHALALAICLLMAAGLLPRFLHAQVDDCRSPDCLNEKINEIDHHLTATDTRVETNRVDISARMDKIESKLDDIEKEIAGLESNNNIERWAGWGVISLLTGGSFIRPKKKEKEEP